MQAAMATREVTTTTIPRKGIEPIWRANMASKNEFAVAGIAFCFLLKLYTMLVGAIKSICLSSSFFQYTQSNCFDETTRYREIVG
jgi:hypothetical protein